MNNSNVFQIGRASLHGGRGVIVLDTPCGTYEIDLCECQTPVQIEDWEAPIEVETKV